MTTLSELALWSVMGCRAVVRMIECGLSLSGAVLRVLSTEKYFTGM
ncbi:MAG: hypothetical protein WC710_01720 [Gallionella sp.]